MNFEIFSYGSGDFLRMIFNGIAQIFGNNDYLVAIKITALLGFFGILTAAAFQKGKLDLRWILATILINMALIVPKTAIIITDRVVPANSAVVENVPLGITATATFFNRFGDWLTRSFETVFSLPNEIKYSENGLLFAQTLVEESTRFEITTARVSSNLTDFWKSCVYYDIFLGRYSWDDILKEKNLLDFLGTKTSKSRAFTYENINRERMVIPCLEGFNSALREDIENELNNAMRVNGAKFISKTTEHREFTERLNEAVARFSSAMPVAYRYLTNLTLNNSQILSQNILANSFKRGMMNFATDADAAAAAEDFSLAKAEAERRTTFSVMGKLAKKMLPILHNIFESLIYAIFPIVMIMAMLPNATKVLSRYAMALFWINLWSPLYAILHFGVSYHSQKAASVAMVADGNGFLTGLTIMTNTELGNVLSDYAAITGYLSLSIPMISWLVINASGSMMASLAGRLMDGYDRPASSAAAEATSGNVSLGQMNYQNQSAFQANLTPQTTEGTMSYQGADGIRTKTTTNGNYLEMPASSTPLSLNFSSNAGSSIRESYNEATSQEHSTMMDNLQSTGYLSSLKNSTTDHINKSKIYSEGLSEADRHFLSHSNEKSQNLLNQYAKNIGINDSVAKSIRSQVEATAGIGGNIKIAELGAKINAQSAIGKEHISNEQIGKMLQFMSSSQYNEAQSEEATTAKDLLHKLDSSEGRSMEHALSDALDKHQQTSLKHSDSVSKLEQISKQKENYEQTMGSINQAGMDGLMHWMVSKEGIQEETVKHLITQSNLGDYNSLKELNSHAKEYVNDRLNRSNYELDFKKAQSKETIENNFEYENNSFIKKHPISNNLNWADQKKYDNLEARISETFKNPDLQKNRISNHLMQNKQQIAIEGEKLKDEYQKDKEDNALFKSSKTDRVDEFKGMLQ
ncbi:MAG: conjugal transfer protein TraG N-terminal domain-containing protein [Oligoflexia bacterium]|nr:conjugal transfer protein TraG N-terminal domain-containing protein [Oligoflexia bacterium]